MATSKKSTVTPIETSKILVKEKHNKSIVTTKEPVEVSKDTLNKSVDDTGQNMFNQKSFSQTVMDNIKLGLNPFPVETIGLLKLKRSVIPKATAVREQVYVDRDSDLLLASKAVALGITTDELLRQMIWSLNSN